MLKTELDIYIDKRAREFEKTHRTHLRYFLWIIPLGDDWKTKVSAAIKLKLELSGDTTVTYTENDLAALTDARLGNIINKHNDQLPPIFVAQRQARRQRIQDENDAMHMTLMATSFHHGPL